MGLYGPLNRGEDHTILSIRGLCDGTLPWPYDVDSYEVDTGGDF